MSSAPGNGLRPRAKELGSVARWLLVAAAVAGSVVVAASCASQVDTNGEGGEGGGSVECTAAQTACDSGCVDVMSDPFNCGICDHVCASKQCVAGACISACAEPLSECNATCVDTSVDPNNCGLCGVVCDPPLVCNSGVCGVPCDNGKTNCTGVCIDLKTDVANCGMCGKKCNAEATCTNGNCQDLCSPGQNYCSGTCADLQTDELHCGSCPNSCAFDETCEAGVCTKICQAPDTYCSGACVDLTSDPLNCGMCGKACQACENSQCVCPGSTIGPLPATVTGTTSGAFDTLTPGCSFNSTAPEATFAFTAPADGTYHFDTAGSSFDTVLYVRDATCNGPELACDDDGIAPQSTVDVPLVANQTVVVVVDGYSSNSGPFQLNAMELILPPCPETDLGSTFPQTTSGTTAGPSYVGGTCGGDTAPEKSFQFTAPQAGAYTFTTAGSTFDTILYVRDGNCNGPELGCDDDTLAPQSSVTVNLAASQVVVVYVDGYSSNSGAFTLNIQ